VGGATFELKIGQTDQTVLFARDRQQRDRGEGESADTNRDDAGNRVQANPQDTEADIAHVNDCDMANNSNIRRTAERRVLETGVEHVEWKARNVHRIPRKRIEEKKALAAKNAETVNAQRAKMFSDAHEVKTFWEEQNTNCRYNMSGTQSCRQVPIDGQNQL